MFKKIMCLICMGLFFMGCDQSTFTRVNLSNVTHFSSQEDGVVLPGRLVFEVPSEKEFVKSSNFLQATLEKYFLNIKSIKHVRKDVKDYAVVDIDTVIIKRRSDVAPPYYFTVKNDNELFLNLNKSALAQLHVDIKSAFNTGLNQFMYIDFHIIVNNDLDNPVILEFPAIFLDYESVQHGTTFKLNNKESTTITCSGVMVDLASKEEVRLFSIVN